MINITGPAGGSTVRGLVINQTNAGHAFVVGFSIASSNNTISGTTPGAVNVIAGTGDGILLSGAVPGGGKNNVVQGNRIGTNAAGTAALGNLFGIVTNNGGGSNLIGGSVAGAGNLISGNG